MRYVTDLPIAYSVGVFAIDKPTFDRLAEEDRRIVSESMSRVMQELDGVAREDDREARSVLQQSGLEFVDVDQGDIADWRETIESLYPALRARSDIDPALFDRLLALLSEYRGKASVLQYSAR
jgi:TRAP-type C4-dicarboxylate transport system substrate-binding protein